MASVQITPQKQKLVCLVFGRFSIVESQNVPLFVFVPLLAQEPSNLAPMDHKLAEISQIRDRSIGWKDEF